MNKVDGLTAELDRLQAQRRDMVAQRARLVAERDGAELPQDVDKAADVLLRLSAKVDAAGRIVADLDGKIAAVTAQRDAAQDEANRVKVAALDADVARIQHDIMTTAESLEKLIAAYKSNRLQRAAVTGRARHPDNTYGHLEAQLNQLRINAALVASFSNR